MSASSSKYGEKEYPEIALCKRIIGLAFSTVNALGYGYQEKYYQRAFAELLRSEGVKFQRAVCVPLMIGERTIGRYFIDFVVENRVVVEIKIANAIHLRHMHQVLGYLASTGLPIGLLLLITKNSVRIRRVILTSR